MARDKAEIDDWYRHWAERGYGALKRLLPNSPFAGRDAPNIVDACLAPQVYSARRPTVDLTSFPC